MKTFRILAAIIAMGVVVVSGDGCRDVPEGAVVTWGCRAYTWCEGGRPVMVDCHGMGLVFSPDIKRCDLKLKTPAPCGLYRECGNKHDGRYADLEVGCTAFYTCRGGKFYGHNKCSAGLVFNEPAQICDWPYSVAPPCGSKGGVATPKPTPRRPDVKVKPRDRKVKRRRQFRKNRKGNKQRKESKPRPRTKSRPQTKSKRTQIFRDVVHGF